MFIRGILIVITLISHTQAKEVTKPYKLRNSKDLNNNDTNNRRSESSNPFQNSHLTFEKYMKKFEPSTVLEQIEKEKKYNGLTLTAKEHLLMMIEGIDPTDEILELDIENGNPKMFIERDARRGWKPGKWLNEWWRDKFYVRNRLYELMKQAIYQTRNKMTVMQMFRERYHNQSLYKMGYLMHKADDAAKIFSQFSFRAYRSCLLAQEKVIYRLPIFDLLAAHERQLDLLFNIELYTDLILLNDKICKEIFRRRTVKRTKFFDRKFVD